MELLPIGLLVAGAVALIGYASGSAVVVGLFVSIAFGATAFAAVPALGGSSPQIYTLFALAMIAVALLRHGAAQELYRLFRRDWTMPLAFALGVYVVVGAYALPRIFAGKASAFIPVGGRIFEAPLAPVPGNITQPLYFTVGILTFFALPVWLLRTRNWSAVRVAVLAFAAANAVLGLVDILAKVVGIPDILAPIRTASYAYLTSVVEVSFWRIAGGHAEASAFAQSAIAALGISFCYWRATGSVAAFVIAALNAVLLVFSTSSTAYVALVVLALVYAFHVANWLLAGRLSMRDSGAVAILVLVCFATIVLWAAGVKPVQALFNLFDTMMLKKGLSESASERSYWNMQALAGFTATGGLGIGLGSSRTSSWLVAVVAQLGAFGAVSMLILVISIVQDAARVETQARAVRNRERLGIASAARGGALASLLASSVSGASADPGLLFFVCAGVVVGLRASLPDHLTSHASMRPRRRRRLALRGAQAVYPHSH